jgi:hypothetical protein
MRTHVPEERASKLGDDWQEENEGRGCEQGE